MFSDSNSMQKFIQLFCVVGSMFVIKYFVYIICHFSSWFMLPSPFLFSCNALLYLYMTFNYFKSIYIIEEMKCRIWDITFAK
jgi:hypothetical protein